MLLMYFYDVCYFNVSYWCVVGVVGSVFVVVVSVLVVVIVDVDVVVVVSFLFCFVFPIIVLR